MLKTSSDIRRMSSFDAKKDYTDELQVIIPESIALASNKGLDSALNILLSLEKKCRLSNDTKNLKEVCLHMVRLCREKADWIKLNSTLAIINKRNALTKGTITAVVAESIGYIPSTPDVDTKIELIKSLKSVCEGKIYVEGESAQLHFMLATIYEERGDIDTACSTIQDVHVETYGSLTKIQKAEYILEQMRLNLLKRDYIRALIHSRKMNTKTLEESGFEYIKIKFYTMMVEYHTVDKNSWEVCQAYYKIASTTIVERTESDSDAPLTTLTTPSLEQREAMESCILYLILSKFDNEQSDMMHRIKSQLESPGLFKNMALDAVYLSTLNRFTTHEIIICPFEGQKLLEGHSTLRKADHLDPECSRFFIKRLYDRIVQHNLRVVAKYFKRITLLRLGELLQLGSDDLEIYLSEMSFAGDLHVKIDRPAGIVSFQSKKQPEEVLSDWSSDVGRMLRLMESTCHLINRENMVYKADKM